MFFIALLVLCFQINLFAQDSDSVSVYLVKQRWHTGIVIKVSDIDSSFMPELSLVNKFKYFDAGWGDDEFYRYPDFDLGLAIKALFVNTPSTIRIEGFSFDVHKYINYSDIGFEIRLKRNEFNQICKFISATFIKDDKNNPIVIESRYDGNITFYKARGKYNVMNTCNTWVARAFNKAGQKIDGRVIFAEQLFDEINDLKNAKRLK